MNVIFVDRILPDGTHVLIPRTQRPRTCRRADGVPKVAYVSHDAARAARKKHQHLYLCPNCERYHIATDGGHGERTRAA